MLQYYTYNRFTHRKIPVLMVLINEACEESCLLHDGPKRFILFNFHSFSVILTTRGHKKARNLAVLHPMGVYLVASCSSRDSASGSIVFIT